ncbi:MAG: RNA polymerase sigma factor RpoH [Alphaproteobacteria bacterium]
MAENKRTQLPILQSSSTSTTVEGDLSRYLREVHKYPILSQKEEYDLAKKWQDNGDVDAAHKLVTSHLRLVAKIAMGYRGYGLPVSELISEGNLGLMQAVKKYDPDKGFRLSTYAMWWIRAGIQEFVLRSWSLVKMGTTSAQKKLFFNLKKIKNRMQKMDSGDFTPDEVNEISKVLNVPDYEVVNMNRRLAAPDHSLNAPLRNFEDGDAAEWQDFLTDDTPVHDVVIAEKEELQYHQVILDQAMHTLNEREIDILQKRRLSDKPVTLEDLSQKYAVSRERIRQIESRAFEKLQKESIKILSDKDKKPVLCAI